MKFIKIFLLISIVIIIVISMFIFLKIKPTITGEAVVGFSIAKDVFRENITMIANESQIINATINSQIDLMLDSDVTGNIEVAEYTKNPEGDLDVTKIGLRYIIITIDSAITDVLDWATIYIYYTDAEVSNEGVDESTLRMYWYNATSESWQEEDSTGVNTVDNYVWANVTHFSTFGIIATILPAPAPSLGGRRCIENWFCSEWSSCIEGNRTRNCTDLNNCKTIINKPNETKSCIIEKEVLFDVEISVITKEVFAGDEVIAEIELIKIVGEKVDVDVHYSIRDMEGNILATKHKVIAVDVRTSLLARLNVPKNLEPNNYIFYVEVIYGEERWNAGDSFEVIKQSIEISTLAVPTSTIFGILIIILFIFILILYYEYKRMKKLTKLIKKVTEKDLIKYKLIKRR